MTYRCCMNSFCKALCFSLSDNVCNNHVSLNHRSYNDGQTLPPKLVVTTCGANGEEYYHKTFQAHLKNTLLYSEQMVRGAECPVWVFDSSSIRESTLFSNEHPNYVVVKFFDVDGFEELVKSEIAKSKGAKEDEKKYAEKQGLLDDIKKQVRFCASVIMFFMWSSIGSRPFNIIMCLVDTIPEQPSRCWATISFSTPPH